MADSLKKAEHAVLHPIQALEKHAIAQKVMKDLGDPLTKEWQPSPEYKALEASVHKAIETGKVSDHFAILGLGSVHKEKQKADRGENNYYERIRIETVLFVTVAGIIER